MFSKLFNKGEKKQKQQRHHESKRKGVEHQVHSQKTNKEGSRAV